MGTSLGGNHARPKQNRTLSSFRLAIPFQSLVGLNVKYCAIFMNLYICISHYGKVETEKLTKRGEVLRVVF